MHACNSQQVSTVKSQQPFYFSTSREPGFHEQSVVSYRYLYLKNFHNREEVLAARQHVLEYVDSMGKGKFADINNGILNERCGLGCIPFMEVRLSDKHVCVY